MATKFETLKKEFISVHSDSKGMFVSGTSSDFNYVKKCAKEEFKIEMQFTESYLYSDDSIRYYFVIV